jgi:hypothetical protein
MAALQRLALQGVLSSTLRLALKVVLNAPFGGSKVSADERAQPMKIPALSITRGNIYTWKI